MRRSYSPKTEHAVDLSIIVPVFDEKANVRFVLEELHQEFGVRGSNTEFIVVDDGSTDGTLPALIDCLEKTPQLRIVSTESHRGQSAALWLGFAVSRGELIATLDGDGQFFAADLKLLLSEIA